MGCDTIYLSGTGSQLITRIIKAGDKKTGITDYTELVFTSGDSTANGGYLQPFVSESLNPSGDSFTSSAITDDRIPLDTTTLNTNPSGSTDIELSKINTGYIMYLALGGLYSETGTTRQIVPSDSGLPACDLYVYHGATTGFVKEFSCMKVNSLTVNIDGDSVPTFSIDWVGLSDTTITSGTTPALTDVAAYVETLEPADVYFGSNLSTFSIYFDYDKDGTITSDSLIVDNIWEVLDSLSFTINNNIDTSAVGLDGNILAAEPQFVNITGNISFYLPIFMAADMNHVGTITTATGTFSAVESSPEEGDFIDVTVDGTGGDVTGYNAGDFAYYNGSSWIRIDNSSTEDAVAIWALVNMLENLDVGNDATGEATDVGISRITFTFSDTISQLFALNNIVITGISHDISSLGLIQFTVDFECTNNATGIDDSDISHFPISVTETGALTVVQPFTEEV